jgi:TonB-linked SusC/RagA family outer membrane protein
MNINLISFKNTTLKMRITLFLLVFCGLNLFATETYSQSSKVNISVQNISIKEVMREIEKQTDYLFVYNPTEIDVNQKTTLAADNQAVKDVLAIVFNQTDIAYLMEGNSILLMKRPDGIQQSDGKKITGTVTDTNGEPVIGASISEKGTRNGTASDVDGKFSLQVNTGAVLVISYIGYTTQEIAVGNQTSLNITLSENNQALEEVVVVGYGTQKKVNLSGSVSSISGQALANRPVTNVNQALQGLAPGMNLSYPNGQASGIATSAPEINIGGYTSINGGNAFILVDNVPVTAEELSRMNPADIENISLLKDAAASSIYGARAAYGVVLVTTKTAKSEKLKVEADLSAGVRQFIELPDILQDTYWNMWFMNRAQSNPNYFNAQSLEYAKRRMEDPSLPEIIDPSEGWNPRLADAGRWDYYANTDWFDLALHDAASTQNYNVRVSQKTDRLTYTLSAGYYQQNSLINYEDPYTRYNFRGNGTYKLTNWWSLGSNISYARSHFNSPTFSVPGLPDQDLFYQLQSKYVFQSIYNPDGSYTYDGSSSIIGRMKEGGRYDKGVNETQISFNTNVDILKDVWSVKGDVNFRMSNDNIHQNSIPALRKQGPNLPFSFQGTNPAYAEVRSIDTRYTVLNLYTDFHKTFADKHYMQALAGFNQEEYRSDNFWVRSQSMISTAFPTVELTSGAVTKGETINTLALRGFFYRLNYIFDNKYILEFNARHDGTSRYPTDDRWGFFPSGSAAWLLSQEKFFEPVKDALNISLLKFRGSYGSLGNQVNTSYYPYISTMTTTAQIGRLIDGARPMAINQPGTVAGDLTWETVRTVNGGLDLSLFNNKFDLSFDKYTRYTEGMLAKSRSLPAIFGAAEPLTNAADLKTKGWGLSVGYRDKVDAGGSPLSYSVRFMLSDSRAYITKYDNPDKVLSDFYEGQELGEIWGLVNDGFFNTEADIANAPDHTFLASEKNSYKPYLGDTKWKDLNNDDKVDYGSSTVDDPGDRKIIGNSQIRLPYSIDLSGDWKGFDLRLFFQGVGKREMYPNGIVFFGFYADNAWTGPNVKNLDNWGTPDNYNPNAYYPQMAESPRLSGRPQTKYLQDMSYIRLKNLTLGYTLPKTLTDKWKIDRLRFYLSGENLFTLDHIDVAGNDPELLGQGYYLQKVFSVGLNLSF